MTTNEDLKTLIEGHSKSLNGKMDIILGEVGNIKDDIKEIKRKNLRLEAENRVVKEEVSSLKSGIFRLVNKERENNIILFNIKDEKDENIQTKVTDLIKDCKVYIIADKIVEVKRLGKQENKRPACITLSDPKYRNNFFDKAERFKAKKVYLSKDLCDMQRAEKKKLADTQKIMISHGFSCKIENFKLLIGERSFSIQEALGLIASYDNKENSYKPGTPAGGLNRKRSCPWEKEKNPVMKKHNKDSSGLLDFNPESIENARQTST